MRIFGPLVCSTTVAVTEALASASASVVSLSPSTSSTAGRLISAPGWPSIFSTVSTSSTATLYCLPPVLTIAYIVDARLLKLSGGLMGTRHGAHAASPSTCRGRSSLTPRVRKGKSQGHTGSPPALSCVPAPTDEVTGTVTVPAASPSLGGPAGRGAAP